MSTYDSVRQLIYNIVGEIVQIEEESSKAKHKKGAARKQHLVIPLFEEEPLQVIAVKRASEIISVAQLKVLKQKKNDSCGYYALFNIVTTISALFHAEDKTTAVQHLSQITNRTRFWVMYHKVLKELHRRAQIEGNSNYPWETDFINLGVLERPYISHIIKDLHLEKTLCGGVDFDLIALPDFSISYLKNNRWPIHQMQELESIFLKIKNQPNALYAFLIGQTCHWISIVCNKVNNHLEILLFDSRNHNLLDSTDEEFIRIIDKNERKSKKPLDKYLRREYLLSLNEPKLLVNLFHDCIVGGHNVVSLLVELYIEGFLESFDKHVTQNAQVMSNNIDDVDSTTNSNNSSNSSGSRSSAISSINSNSSVVNNVNSDAFVISLMSWLESYWPPPVLKNSVIGLFTTLGDAAHLYISSRTRMKIVAWVKLIDSNVDFENCKIPIVSKFGWLCFGWFKRNFRN